MTWRIDPVCLGIAVLFEVATGIAAASDVSILVVWAGMALTTGTLVIGVDRAGERRRH